MALAFLLFAGWAWLSFITVIGIQQLGLNASMTVFAGDMAHPWRAQFNTDLLLHMALVAAWIIYRTRSRVLGGVLALLTLNGTLFSFAYVFVLLFMAKGDLRKVLLGWRAESNVAS